MTQYRIPLSMFVRLMALAIMLASTWPCSIAWAQPKKGGGSKPYRLATLSTQAGTAFAMNEAVLFGSSTKVEVVGEVEGQPCHWSVTTTGASETTATTLLPLPDDWFAGAARDINNAGIIVGNGVSPTDEVQALLWGDPSIAPVVLPAPRSFSGSIQATNINNASQRSGYILGTLDGRVPDGSGGVQDAGGIIVWRYSVHENTGLVVSPPTWFSFSNQLGLKIGLNDTGWIVLTDGSQAHRYRLGWEWVWDPAAGSEGAFVEVFDLAEGGNLFGSNVQWARAGGINQAGDAAASFRAVNSQAHTLVAKRLNGSDISFPKFTTKRDQVDEINAVQALNNATAQHGVQILGNVGWVNTRYGSFQNPRPALWETGGSVRLLEDITTYPSDANYAFKVLSVSMYDLNDASWICGFVLREASGQWTDVPAVLIRN